MLKNSFGDFGVFRDFCGFRVFGDFGGFQIQVSLLVANRNYVFRFRFNSLGTIRVIITGRKRRVFTHTGIVCSNSGSITGCKQGIMYSDSVSIPGVPHYSTHYTKLHQYWLQTQSVYVCRDHNYVQIQVQLLGTTQVNRHTIIYYVQIQVQLLGYHASNC